VLFNGVPAIATPKVVPVIFPGNTFDAQVRAFFASLPTSGWWADTTAEYGVGPITLLPVYVPTDPPPTLDTVDQWIADLAASAPPGLPAPDDNTIYAIVLPQGWQQAEGACVTFGGYHETTTTASGQTVIHTVNPTCTVPYLGLVGIDDLTDGLSHEIEESATDPASASYIGTNWAGSAWATAGEGSPYAETADMCEFQPDSTLTDPQTGFVVQRIWSNVAAAGGHDPCKPLLPGEGPYFTAEPLPPDGTQAENFGYSRGVSLEPGGEVTIPVALRSDGPVGEWQLSAEELPNPHLLPDAYNELSFSWDRASGRAGDVRYLTIKRAPPPDGGTPVFLRVAIQSTLGSVVHTNWLVVGTDETVPGDTNLALDWL
jgi:hypothetical protein